MPDLGGVDLRRSDFEAVGHSDVRLHAETPVVALPREGHLGVTGLVLGE